MAARTDELRMVDPVLTTLSQGYTNSAMIADYLFPTVEVSKLKGKIPVFGKEAFVVRDSFRAIRAQSNRIPPSDLTLVDFETKERDIEIALDYLEEEEATEGYRLEQRLAKQLADMLLLTKEKEVADLVQNTANFASDMKRALTSADAFNIYTATVTPMTIIRSAIEQVRNKIGRLPNTMVMGRQTFNTLIDHPAIVDRLKYSGLGVVTSDVLGEIFGIPKVCVGASVYSNDGSTFTDVWSDTLIIAYVDQNEKANRSEYAPSYGYIFEREGKPEIDTYYENGGKLKVIRATGNYCVKITAADAAYLITNTYNE